MELKKGCNKRTVTTMAARVRWLNKWCENQEYSPICQASFLHIYYCTLCSLLEENDAKAKLKEMNKKLRVPFSDASLQQLVFKKGDYRYKDETIIDKLCISEADCRKYGIGKGAAERQERESRKQQKERLYKRILDSCGENDFPTTIDELCSEFPDVSRSTIQRLTAKNRRRQKSLQEAQIISMWRDGKSVKEIAASAGCGKDRVYSILGFGKKPKKTIIEVKSLTHEPRFASESLKEIFSLRQEGSSKSAAAADELMLSLKALNLGGNIFLTGEGGTGKSYIIEQFIKQLPSTTRKNTLIVAPTWKAASIIGGTTIHKAFHLELGVLKDINIIETPKALKTIEKVIIDEVSMVRIDIFHRIIRIIQHIEQTQNRKIQIIAVGDFGQIEPIVTKDDLKSLKEAFPFAESNYAFSSECWEDCHFKTIRLEHIHRQTDAELTDYLTRLKYGDQSTIDWFNNNLSHEEDPNAACICPTNELVNRYNYAALDMFPSSEIRTYDALIDGDIEGQELPCPKKLELSVGMRVMVVLSDRQYKNGSIGTVTTLTDDAVTVKLGDKKPTVVRRKAVVLDNGTTYKQFPFVLAYAITANRAEGIELDAVNIVPGFFAAGQLYVALTRCRTREGIHLIGNLKKHDLIVNEAALRMTL